MLAWLRTAEDSQTGPRKRKSGSEDPPEISHDAPVKKPKASEAPPQEEAVVIPAALPADTVSGGFLRPQPDKYVDVGKGDKCFDQFAFARRPNDSQPRSRLGGIGGLGGLNGMAHRAEPEESKGANESDVESQCLDYEGSFEEIDDIEEFIQFQMKLESARSAEEEDGDDVPEGRVWQARGTKCKSIKVKLTPVEMEEEQSVVESAAPGPSRRRLARGADGQWGNGSVGDDWAKARQTAAKREKTKVAKRRAPAIDVEAAKKKRLADLLAQTDECLQKVSVLLRKTRDVNDEDDATDGSSNKENKAPVSYFDAVHAKVELIDEQPKTLDGPGKLKGYQMQGLEWLVSLHNNSLNGILADEMGLGKTLQTIALMTYLAEKKGIRGPHLIVVPLSTLGNWISEFETWSPSTSCFTYRGPAEERAQALRSVLRMSGAGANVLLTTYEYALRDSAQLGKLKWTYLVLDEGHRIKNKNCKLMGCLKRLRVARKLLLTGTPLQNNLTELWALLNFLMPDVFDSGEDFESWFNSPFASSGGKASVALSQEEKFLVIDRLHQVLRPFILRRLKADVLKDLPTLEEKVVWCDLSGVQRRLYEQVQHRACLTTQDLSTGKFKFKALNNVLMQLRKLCNHPYLLNDLAEYNLDEDFIRAAGKLVVLDDMLRKLKAAGHRVLIFTQMTRSLDILQEFCEVREHSFLRLDGSTKADEREPLLQKYNEEGSEYFIFMLSTRAGGVGINLQTADTVILYDSDFNPFADLQAQARAHRLGQRNDVVVFRMATRTPVEEEMLSRSARKLDAEQKIIGAGEFNADGVDSAERKKRLVELLAVDVDTALENGGEAFNEIIARNEKEKELFNGMDKTGGRLELMKAKEMPDWLMQDSDELAKPAGPLFDFKAHAKDIDTSLIISTSRRNNKECQVHTAILDPPSDLEDIISDSDSDAPEE